MLVAAINQTSVATVLPTIARDLHGLDLYTWVFTASMLATSVAVPIFGKLSDVHGRRPLFIVGMLVFIAGAIACGLSQTMFELIISRALQGIGMGAIMPLTMAIIADVIPASERGKWQGLLGVVFGIATVMGPLAGGWIADQFGWRWIFWINLPLAFVALVTVVTQLHLPHHRREGVRIDWLGAVGFAVSISALLLALSEGGTRHPWSSPYIISLFAGSAIGLIAFGMIERRATDPMIPLQLMRERNVLATSIAGLAIGAGMFAAIFFEPLFMQVVLGVSSSRSGLALVPLMLGLIVTSSVAGIIVTRTGRYKLIMCAGPVVSSLGLVLMHRMGETSSIADVSWRVFIVGAGIGMVMQNLVLVAQNSVAAQHTGVATGLASLTRAAGGTVGTAILGTIFASELRTNISKQLHLAGIDPRTLGGKLDAQSVLASGPRTMPAPLHHAITIGTSQTLTDLFMYSLPFMGIALIACLALRRDELASTAAVSVVETLEQEAADLVPVDAAHAPEAQPAD